MEPENTTKEPPKDPPIVEIKAYAKAGNGNAIVLWIKSARVEEIFCRLSGGQAVRAVGKSSEEEEQNYFEDNPSLKWLKGRRIWQLSFPPSLPSDAWAWGTLTRPITSNGFNLKALSFVGLSEGLEFPLDVPMSNSMLKHLVRSAKEACRELILEYGKAAPKFSSTLTEGELAAPSTPRV